MVRLTKQRDKQLEEEIRNFMEEMQMIIETKRNIPNNTGLEFSPFLFMDWRLWKQNENR